MNHRGMSFRQGFVLKAGLVVAAALGVSAAQADTVRFNTLGTGIAGSLPVTSAISTHGSGFVMSQANPADPTSFVFQETGAYQLTQADGVSPIGYHDITLLYTVSGTVNPFTGLLSFATGSFNLFSDANFNFGSMSADPMTVFGASDGTLIGSFQIAPGTGYASGTVHMEGSAIAGSILPGYFFSGTGVDLSLTDDLQFAIDIGNALEPSPTTAQVSELVCKASAFPGPGCNGMPYSNTPYYFVVSDGGQVVVSTHDVPEPASAMLVFAGLAGIGFMRRSRKQ